MHGQDADDGADRAADEDDVVVVAHARVDQAEQAGDGAGDVERKGAVGEEVRVELQRAERQLLDREGDAALVGMEEVAGRRS